jgi:hypothetical protein
MQEDSSLQHQVICLNVWEDIDIHNYGGFQKIKVLHNKRLH